MRGHFSVAGEQLMWLNWPTDGESERGEWKDGEKNEETRKRERERARERVI